MEIGQIDWFLVGGTKDASAMFHQPNQRHIPSANSLIGDPEFDTDIRSAELAELLKSAPGPDAMARLLQLEKNKLTPADRIDYLTCWQRQVSWVTAQEQEAILYVSGTQYIEKSGEFEVDSEEQIGRAHVWTPVT